MGISQSQPNKQYHSEHLQQFNLPQYGGTVMVDKINKIVFKDISVATHERDQFEALLNERMKLKHPNLAEILQVQLIRNQDNHLCGENITKYRIIYNLYAYSLFNQLKNCCLIKKPLPEKEICRIFENVVSCLEYLQQMKTIHGDIKVGNIFMDKHRNVKITDSFFLKRGKTSFEVVMEQPLSMSLLAPQQLDLLKLKLSDTLSLSHQKEIFAVGLTMIETTTIQQGMKCYDLDSLKIKDEFFIYMLEHIQSCGYSFPLSNLIMSCVHKNPTNRPHFSQFLSAIREIKNVKRFYPQ